MLQKRADDDKTWNARGVFQARSGHGVRFERRKETSRGSSKPLNPECT